MSKSYCINCWYDLTRNYKNCPSCGYPDNEGENMTLEALIEQWDNGELDNYDKETRRNRMIDLLIERVENQKRELELLYSRMATSKHRRISK